MNQVPKFFQHLFAGLCRPTYIFISTEVWSPLGCRLYMSSTLKTNHDNARYPIELPWWVKHLSDHCATQYNVCHTI